MTWIGIVGIMLLPEMVDYDTLLIAPALATHAGSARPVVDELLEVAKDPDRMQGVDPTLIRVRAADLLSLEHDAALLDDAVDILREAVAMALPGEIAMAQDALAKTLAEQGNIQELAALVRTLLREPPSQSWAITLLQTCSIATIFGYGRQAAGWLDEALAAIAASATATAPASRPDRAARGAARSQTSTIRDVLQDARKRLAKIRAAMTADGCDPDDPAAARARMRIRPAAAATISSHPPWPAGFQGCLVWWPEPDYTRLTRNLPEFATALGDPWRGHTARVQAAMNGNIGPTAGAAGPAAAPLGALVAADFGQFVQFLEWSRADPLAPSTMTAFGALAQRLPAPVKWPPKDRAPCWCGSGNRYRDCCARPSAPG